MHYCLHVEHERSRQNSHNRKNTSRAFSAFGAQLRLSFDLSSYSGEIVQFPKLNRQFPLREMSPCVLIQRLLVELGLCHGKGKSDRLGSRPPQARGPLLGEQRRRPSQRNGSEYPALQTRNGKAGTACRALRRQSARSMLRHYKGKGDRLPGCAGQAEGGLYKSKQRR